MCGFAGLYTARGYRGDELRSRVERMIEPIVHRGPDDAGIWLDESTGVALGFRRLAIVDLSPLGHQPMASPSGRFTMVFNGEVYNAADLASELRDAGFRFRGHSDTEVMLAAFEHWGIEASVCRFVGMFAIGLWDARERRLHLIRDRLGKKPLFVHQRAGHVSFGSELKSLMGDPEFERVLDPAALDAYLRFFYVPAPASIFRGTTKVVPGTILTISDPRLPLPACVPYWSARDAYRQASASPFAGDDDAAVSETDRLLRDATAMRMAHSDVPVGAFLSGGIDSTTVVALMQAQASRPVKTYTIGFEDVDFNEATHAAAIARHLGTEHTTVYLQPEEGLGVVPALAEMFDEPFADVSQIPTYLVSRLARRDVTVALSGDGGDEVFGGYNRYVWGDRVFRTFDIMPHRMRRLLGRGITAVSPRRWDSAYSMVSGVLPAGLRHRLPGERLHKVGALMATNTAADFYRSLVQAWNTLPTSGARHEPYGATFEQVMSGATSTTMIDRMMLTDLLTYLPDNNLAKVDRASMAVSLEVRTPLLDHRVVEFALGLPIRMKIRDGVAKWILRQVLYRYVPQSLVDREKMGFDVPIGRWLRGPLREWAAHLIEGPSLEKDGVLDAPAIRAVWREHLDQKANHGHSLWVVLMLQAWRERWSC